MNAKITITVPMNKLNITVGELLESIAKQFDDLSIDVTSISTNVVKEENLLKQITDIDAIRKKLALLDANLEDCYSILSGLIKYKTQQSGQDNANNTAK